MALDTNESREVVAIQNRCPPRNSENSSITKICLGTKIEVLRRMTRDS